MDQLLEVLKVTAIGLLNAAIPVLGYYGRQMFLRWKEKIMADKSHEEQLAINNHFKRIKAIFRCTIDFIEKTEVAKLKSCDRWDEVGKVNAKRLALEMFNKIISQNDIYFIKTNVSNYDTWCEITLESIVKEYSSENQ